MEEKDALKDQSVGIGISSLERVVPKFCTAINLAVLDNTSIVLSLLYTEAMQSTLIERVMLDVKHAKNFHDILGKIIRDAENNNDGKK